MEAKAIARFIPYSPTKIRPVVNLIRGKKIEEALNLVHFSPKRAAKAVGKTLKSAIANAQTNHSMNLEALVVSKIFVDKGPGSNRFTPRAMGRATSIYKPTAHITVVLKESEEILKQIQAEQAVASESKKQKGKKKEGTRGTKS